MHEYDVALKRLLQTASQSAIRELTGVAVREWLNVELPKVQIPRVDLLGETADGELIHLELQSSNSTEMALRMAEYFLAVYRVYDRFPRQLLIYIGREKLRMRKRLNGAGMRFQFAMIDLRQVDGTALFASGKIEDNIVATLTNVGQNAAMLPELLKRIATLDAAAREEAFVQLLLIAGLRGLEDNLEQEARNVPILNDILDHKVLGREFKRGLAEGEARGELRGQVNQLRKLLEKRFGPVPAWAEQRLAGYSSDQIAEVALRLLDAQSLEELLLK